MRSSRVALFGLVSSLYSSCVFAIRHQGSQPLPQDTRFASGDLNAIAYNKDDDHIEATVSRRGLRVLEITAPPASASILLLAQLQQERVPANRFRGDSAFVYERALESLKTLMEP